MTQKLTIAVLAYITIFGNVCANQNSRYIRLIEAKIEGIWTVYGGTQNALICCTYCYKQECCVGVNYNKDSMICELLSKSSPTEQFDVISNQEWTVYYVNLAVLAWYSPTTSMYLKIIDWYQASTISVEARHQAIIFKYRLGISNINVISGATAWQSSVDHNGVAPRAIDGNKNTFYSSNTCMHTANMPNQWWMVDFGRDYVVSGVIIWNRSDDSLTGWLKNMLITVSRTSNTIGQPSSQCATYPGPSTSLVNPITITCVKEQEGRFLKVLKNENEALFVMCEIEFF